MPNAGSFCALREKPLLSLEAIPGNTVDCRDVQIVEQRFLERGNRV